MKIIFNEKAGEVFDFFRGIWSVENFDYVNSIKEEYGISESNQFEEGLLEIFQNKNYNDGIGKYQLKEMRPEFFLDISKMWTCEEIGSYLTSIRNSEVTELLEQADRTIQLICKNNYEVDDNRQDLKENIMELLVDNDLQLDLKWQFIMFLRDPREYVQKLVDEYDQCMLLYDSLLYKRQLVLEAYNEELKTNLELEGLDYLIKEIHNTYDFNQDYTIKVTTSALISLRIYTEDNTHYVIIGPNIRKALISNKEDTIEKNLSFIRGISEPNRYKIIQLLKRGDHYGQEIADKLNITKTNVFYHLDFLISLNLIKIIKDGQRNYYSIDWEELNKSLEVFSKIW